MQIEEILNEGLNRELQVTIAASILNEKTENQLEQMRAQANIKGFRPGKVPLGHLRKLYGDSVKADIVNSEMGNAMREALEERKEKPALQPKVDLDEEKAKQILDGDADLIFKMSYEIVPEIKLADFSKFEIERPIYDVPEDEVESELENLAKRSRTYTPRPKTQKAKDEDEVTIDFIGKIDGEAFENGSGEDVKLVLGSGQFIPGFEEQLVGAKMGEEKELNVSFPSEYPSQELAGKEAIFEVSVKAVAKPEDAKIDDSLAEKFGFDALDKLKDALKTEMENSYGSHTRNKVREQLLDLIEEKHDFDLPASLVESEFTTLWGQHLEDMKRHNMEFDEAWEKKEPGEREKFQKLAERRVRLGLVLSQIGEENNIEVSEAELQRALYERMGQFPGQEKQMMEYFQKTPEAMASIRAPIYEDKIVDFLVELAKVSDKPVSKDDLLPSHDHDHDHDHDHNHDH